MSLGTTHRQMPLIPPSAFFLPSSVCYNLKTLTFDLRRRRPSLRLHLPQRWKRSGLVGRSNRLHLPAISAALPPLDLTEDNVRQVLADARSEFGQMFDTSVGMTGEAKLAEMDGPFVKISLTGRFWHKRSTVLDRVANYLKQRIPEILEVDIEDEKQFDDSPDNF